VLCEVRSQSFRRQFGNGDHGPSRNAVSTIVTPSFPVYNMTWDFFLVVVLAVKSN